MDPRDLKLIDEARRRASRILSLLDLLTPAEAIRMIQDTSPALSPLAIQIVGAFAQLVRFNFEALSLVLTGQVDDATLAQLEVQESSRFRQAPDEIAEALMFGTPFTPPAGTTEGDRRG
jgi:hypothetical protein